MRDWFTPEHSGSIDGDNAFPQYRAKFRLVADIEPDKMRYHADSWAVAGNRAKRGTSIGFDSVGPLTWLEAQREAERLVYAHVADKYKDCNPSVPMVRPVFERWETWRLNWFNHVCRDVGQTDSEAVASFQRYVYRMQALPDTHFMYLQDSGRMTCSTSPGFPLMGADDRWRWRGGEEGQPEGRSESSLPCRCKWCKARGVLMISH